MPPPLDIRNLAPALLKSLWRISPATFAMTLTAQDPQPWVAAPHLKMLSDWIVAAVAGRKKRIIVNMPPRHGKPVHVDTPVLMADGSQKPLAAVRVGDEVITHLRHARRVLAVHEQGLLPCVRISTDSGRTVVAALDHPFMTTRGWMIAGELSDGDVLALLPEARTDAASTGRTDADFRMAGYFVGDGSAGISKAGAQACNVTSFDTDVSRDIEAQASALGWAWRWSKRGRIDFRAGTGQPRQWLRDAGIAGKVSVSKSVPGWVFQGTAQQIAHFLSAYFLCDGTINSRGKARADACFEFYSVSRVLLEGVRHLLLRLGVRSRLTRKNGRYAGQKHQSWRLSITSRDDVSRFIDAVPLLGYKLARAVGWRSVPARFRGAYIEDPVVSVEPMEDAQPCRCLTVADDSTFLADDLVVHNSELISKWTPVWFLDNYPQLNVINCGYGNDFAREWGRKTKELVSQFQGQLRFSLAQDSRASDRWNTKQGGGMKTAGIGGGITGRGAHLMIIDDPIKDDAEANSLLERDRVWNWWRGTARTRLEPDACVILCMTRWHDDDLAGRLIKAGEKGEGEVWEVLNLPAIAEDTDVLARTPGEALWPARYPVEALMALMTSVGPDNWAAQFQGHPANLVSIGNVYKSFNKVANVRPVAFDPRRPLVWSLDFNVDPMCSAICQWHEETTPFTLLNNQKRQVISVLQEVCLPNSSTQEACEEFVSRTEQYRRIMGNRPLNVRIYGDRSGQSRKTVGDSDYTAIRDFFRLHSEYRVTMHLSRANPAVKDRVNAVNTMLCNALGESRTWIDPACTELIKDFRQVQWKRDSGGNTTGQIDKSDMSRTHVSDAYGYFVCKEFGLKSQSGGFSGVMQ